MPKPDELIDAIFPDHEARLAAGESFFTMKLDLLSTSDADASSDCSTWPEIRSSAAFDSNACILESMSFKRAPADTSWTTVAATSQLRILCVALKDVERSLTAF